MDQILFIIKAIILGIIEGITEFLPISSTGHLIIASDILGMPQDAFMKMFMVVIQLAAILAVLFLFWQKLWYKLKLFFTGRKEGLQFVLIWMIACLPAALLGFLLNDLIDKYLFSVYTVVGALIIGGILLILLEKAWAKRGKKTQMEEISNMDAAFVGLWQCLAMWPGFSRSAATIMGGWSVGMTTSLATEFSFFLAIPVMFGASGLKLVKFNFAGIQAYQYIALISGFLLAFVTALLVVKAFIRFVQTKGLKGFAYYRFVLAVVLIVLLIFKVL